MDYDTEFLEKIRCPKCEKNNFSVKIMKEELNLNGYIICNNCNTKFNIDDGILYFLPHIEEKTLWDNLYVNNVKGNFQKNKDDIYDTLKSSLNDRSSALTYYSLIGLVSRSNMIFNYSLEIGCGTASYSLLLKKFGYIKKPVLIDTSLTALKTAQLIFRDFNEDAYFIYANALNTPFLSKSFDLCLSGGLIEHFKGLEQEKIVSEHCRVATRVICQFPTNSTVYWIQRIGLTILNGKWPFGYEKPISYIDANRLFKNEGFEIISSSYHDFLTALFFRLSKKYRSIEPLKDKTFVNTLFNTDLILLLRNSDINK
jgi:SAM-dependent methyltransferase